MYKQPTYEDYLKATKYARFRYKYGLFVTVLCLIALIFLIFYIYDYGEELASNPLVYAARSYNSTCECDFQEGKIYANSTVLSDRPLTKFGGIPSGIYRGVEGSGEAYSFNST